ncbi:MAG: ChbG/HpnK family deacetylase [Selenomonadaceae bacterium]|nr:ChbG/HpnK family deacetylase [Selenomonadaceae bacterium]
MKNLIVNADDFGRHELINRAVERAFKTGCLRSATLMAGGIAFDDAIAVAKRNSGLGVGIHFTLANGNPILPPKEIPTLVTPEGIFHENYIVFLKRYMAGKISLDEVRSELAAQLEKILRTGLTLTHVDSHQHLHHVPGIIDIVLDLAASKKIFAMRSSGAKIFDGELDSLGKFVGRLGLSSLAKFAAHKAHKKNFLTPEHFAGIVAGESVDENFMLKLIDKLQDGTTEVMLHPGTDNKILCDFCDWNHDFEAELFAVTSPKVLAALAEKNISAVNFSALEAKHVS